MFKDVSRHYSKDSCERNSVPETHFDPDKLIDSERFDPLTENVNRRIDPDKLVSFNLDSTKKQDGGASSERNRLEKRTDSLPRSFEDGPVEHEAIKNKRLEVAGYSKGKWSGDVGNSELVPDDAGAREKIAEHGRKGVEYKDGIVDFAPFSKETVKIHIGPNRLVNRNAAFKALSEKWNNASREGRANWTTREARDWARAEGLEFHECNDRETVQFVPAEIHRACKHLGGVSEAKRREQLSMGEFDD